MKTVKPELSEKSRKKKNRIQEKTKCGKKTAKKLILREIVDIRKWKAVRIVSDFRNLKGVDFDGRKERL